MKAKNTDNVNVHYVRIPSVLTSRSKLAHLCDPLLVFTWGYNIF